MELLGTLTSQDRFTTYQSMHTDLGGLRKGILIVCFLFSEFEKNSLINEFLEKAIAINAENVKSC